MCCFVVLQWPKVLNAPLSDVDPELFDIIEKEKNRQYKVRHQQQPQATDAIAAGGHSRRKSQQQQHLGKMHM